MERREKAEAQRELLAAAKDCIGLLEWFTGESVEVPHPFIREAYSADEVGEERP